MTVMAVQKMDFKMKLNKLYCWRNYTEQITINVLHQKLFPSLHSLSSFPEPKFWLCSIFSCSLSDLLFFNFYYILNMELCPKENSNVFTCPPLLYFYILNMNDLLR